MGNVKPLTQIILEKSITNFKIFPCSIAWSKCVKISYSISTRTIFEKDEKDSKGTSKTHKSKANGQRYDKRLAILEDDEKTN